MNVAPAPPVLAAIALLVLVALLGGGARGDIYSLVVLRPLTVLIAGWALLTLNRHERAGFGDWLLLAASVILLVLVHLVPLPPSIWRALPGREVIVAVDAAAGLGDPWRPLSMAPELTRNALWSLAAPLAALVLAVRGGSAGERTMLSAVLLAGLVSGVLGVIQFGSGPSSPLYLYRISNFGSAVGLFANRNHAGVFLACLFPLLAAFVVAGLEERGRRARLIGALAMAAALVPMILTTGSRAGLITGVVGLVGAALIARPYLAAPSRRAGRMPRRALYVGLAIAFLAFCAVFIGLNQGNSVDRLIGGPDAQTELRWPIWRVTLDSAWQMFPWGSGIGGFTPVFALHEPDAMLGPSYVNHAHNDFLEVLLDGGIAGILLLAAALVLLARDGWRVWRRPAGGARAVLARAASVALVQLIVASLFDYPLRTPLLAVIGATLLVWLRRGALATTGSSLSEISADPPYASRSR